jgi:hypothetical protein
LFALILPLAVAGYIQEAQLTAQALTGEPQRLQALTQLAHQLAQLGDFEAARDTAHMIKKEDDQVKVLAELTASCPEPLKEAALRQALAGAVALDSGGVRFEVLGQLAPRLAALPLDSLIDLWLNTSETGSTLHTLAQRPRPDLLLDLLALEPVLARLGQAEAIGETFCSILEVGRWWP